MASRLQRRALREGARIMGGEARLCEMLDVPPAAFPRWLEGVEAMPQPAFAMLLDFLSDLESQTPPR